MMTIREIESGSDIMEVNRLAGLIWHEAYRGIVSREQIAYMIERFQSVRAITEQLALEGYRYYLMEDEGRAVGYCGVAPPPRGGGRGQLEPLAGGAIPAPRARDG